ncbi:hypothetical protein H0H92_001143 [Tricholoma furcatifolium]|nr:hypothetical protein H0H92_001143 [Tricholoma furcatifolium]
MSTGHADLTTTDGVQTYLANTIYASHAITALSGGSANFTYRIHLIKPVDGQETLILKHAQPYVKDYVSLPFSLERQTFEYEALTRVKAWLPADSIVTVPVVYKFDKEQNVLIMEDCGTNVLTLKDFALRCHADASQNLASMIGKSLGKFICGMHEWSRANPDGILDIFAENTEALQLSPWATYGRLVETLKPGEGNTGLPALRDPTLVVSDADLDVVNKVASEVSTSMIAARDCFVMGDFWPGNIMVVLDDEGTLEKLYLLDWELAKPGVPGVEIGQFCAEIHLVRRFVPAAESFASAILDSFLHACAEETTTEIDLARSTLAHWGTHLVVWTPRVFPWSDDKARTRSAVEEGIQLIVTAIHGDEESLSTSFVGPLAKK